MNANELADKLEKCCLVSWGECNHEDYDTDIWTKMKSATMLRQQQAEIEALKAEATNTVMAEHCTCYKLGYSQLNNYAKVEMK
jgi:hypothetical protein